MGKLNINNNQFVVNDGYLEKVFLCDKRIVIPSGVTVIGSLAFDVSFDDDGIDKCYDRKNIEEIVLPNTLVRIEPGAFKHCNLSKIKLPESLKYLGRGVFLMNTNLEEVEMYDNLKDIESYAFSTKMKSVKKLFKWHLFDRKYYIVDIPYKFIINYSNYYTLDGTIDLLKKSGSFGSGTYKLRMFRIPRYEFILIGPSFAKRYRKKICKKLSLIKCKRVKFISTDLVVETPSVSNNNLVNNKIDNNDKDINNEKNENINNIDVLNEDGVSINNSDNNLEDNGRSR